MSLGENRQRCADRHGQGPRAQRGHDRHRGRHRPVRAGRRHGRLQRRRSGQRHRRQDHHQSGARCRRARGPDRARPGIRPDAPSIILRDAIHRANKIIYHTSKTQPQCEGMGTTVVACLFHDNKMSIAHVGDSRLYRLRDNRFEQMTLDHSLLQELVDRGFYSQQEAQRATNKNYVTRALGSSRMSKSRSTSSRCRRVTTTCSVRTASPT
jgi:serine/threonine protein phosphatase PrpC